MRLRSPEASPLPTGGPRPAPRRLGAREAVLLAALAYALVVGGLSMYKHETFLSSRFDLGNMDQAVWNSSQGRVLEATNEEGELVSRLENHTDFLLLAFVPFYWISPSPHWLLVAQAAVVGLGALPLFWLARRFLGGREGPAAMISVAYLFNPGLQAANLFDFHAQMMAGTFLLFAFHYMLERRLLPFVLFGALAALTKEGTVLVVGMMGLYALFVLRRPRWGVPAFLASAAYFLLTMLVIIPYFNTGDSSGLVEERYAAFGGSLGGVVRTALTDPLFTLAFVLSNGKAAYLFYLAAMAGILGILAPAILLLPLPELAVNLLSDRPQMANVRYHYSAAILPFAYAAAAAGIANLLGLLGRLRGRGRLLSRLAPGEAVRARLPAVLAAGVLLLNVQLCYSLGPLPLFHSPGNTLSVIDPTPAEHRRALDEAVAMVPEGAKVSATNQVGPHLAHRRHLYLFPTIQDAEYVVVDETTPAYDTAINPVLNLQSTKRLRESGDFRVVYEKSGVVVFERVGR